MRKALVKGSKEAKAFMAKLRAKKASATKSIKNVATNVKRVAKGAKNAFREGYCAKDKVGGIKTKYIFNIYKLNEFGDTIPSSKKQMSVVRVNQSTAKEVVYRKYPYRNHRIELENAFNIGSTLLIEKGENPRKKPARVVQIDRTKKGKFKKFSKVSGVNHKDTKSHNVNIRVVSGVDRKTGFINGLIIKTYTLSELKKINPIYFDKGNDKFFGVYKRKLMVSKKLNSQVMIEASKNNFGGEIVRQYTVRNINPNGKIETPKRFDTIFGASDYIGKNIIL